MIAYAYALAIDSSGNAYITGAAHSELSYHTRRIQDEFNGQHRVSESSKPFVMKFSLGIPASISATAGTPQNATINTAFATALQQPYRTAAATQSQG